MKAAVVHTFGQPPRFEDFPEPQVKPDHVLVHIRAAGLHPIVKGLASGRHYGSTDVLPFIPGVDGVGALEDGTRVFFGMTEPPYGTLAERAAVPRQMCMPLPESLDDITAAALFNPGISAWLALTWRGQLAAGETVLIMGATGSAGKIAVQVAKHLGAGKVIAVGRKARVLNELPKLGADATISLDQPDETFIQALTQEAGEAGIHVIIDYLWGHPTEMALAAITRKGLTHVAPRVRLVEVGQIAGATMALPGAILRSSGLEIYGSGAGTAPMERIFEAMPQLLAYAASGALHLDTEQIPLAAVEEAWTRETPDNRRLILVP